MTGQRSFWTRAWVVLLFVVMPAPAFFAACGSDAPSQTGLNRATGTTAEQDSAPASLRITESDTGKTFEVRAGGTIELVLAADPSSGYLWELDDPDPEASLLEQLKEPVFVPDDPQDEESAGTLTYTFRAADAGQMVVTFVYLDPEVVEAPAKTVQFDLIVR